MTTEALIFFVGSCIAIGIFALYVGLHNGNKPTNKRSTRNA